MGTQCPGRLPGGRVDGKAEPRREPVQPQDAQGILFKAGGGVAHGPQDALLQVLLPPKGVDKPLGIVVGHGIDGKVPPGQVLPHIRHKVYLVRVAAVGIGPLGAEGSGLVQLAAVLDGHGAVLQPGGDALPLPEQCQHLLRPGTGAKVPVLRGAPQQTVPHAAAHRVGRISGPVQPGQQSRRTGVQSDVLHGSRLLVLQGDLHPVCAAHCRREDALRLGQICFRVGDHGGIVGQPEAMRPGAGR